MAKETKEKSESQRVKGMTIQLKQKDEEIKQLNEEKKVLVKIIAALGTTHAIIGDALTAANQIMMLPTGFSHSGSATSKIDPFNPEGL